MLAKVFYIKESVCIYTVKGQYLSATAKDLEVVEKLLEVRSIHAGVDVLEVVQQEQMAKQAVEDLLCLCFQLTFKVLGEAAKCPPRMCF